MAWAVRRFGGNGLHRSGGTVEGAPRAAWAVVQLSVRRFSDGGHISTVLMQNPNKRTEWAPLSGSGFQAPPGPSPPHLTQKPTVIIDPPGISWSRRRWRAVSLTWSVRRPHRVSIVTKNQSSNFVTWDTRQGLHSDPLAAARRYGRGVDYGENFLCQAGGERTGTWPGAARGAGFGSGPSGREGAKKPSNCDVRHLHSPPW